MTELTVESATASGTSSIKSLPKPTVTFASLARESARLRDRVEMTQSDVTDLHRLTQLGALDERTATVALQEPNELLQVLSDEWGLSWSTVARMVGVTDAAVRKWRRGEQIAPENRRRLARAVAFLQLVNAVYPVGDAANWLEMRVSEDATVTAVEIFGESRADLLFELVGRRMTPHQVLDAFDPNWRASYSVDERFDVVGAPDGHPVIVERRRNEV